MLDWADKISSAVSPPYAWVSPAPFVKSLESNVSTRVDSTVESGDQFWWIFLSPFSNGDWGPGAFPFLLIEAVRCP